MVVAFIGSMAWSLWGIVLTVAGAKIESKKAPLPGPELILTYLKLLVVWNKKGPVFKPLLFYFEGALSRPPPDGLVVVLGQPPLPFAMMHCFWLNIPWIVSKIKSEKRGQILFGTKPDFLERTNALIRFLPFNKSHDKLWGDGNVVTLFLRIDFASKF